MCSCLFACMNVSVSVNEYERTTILFTCHVVRNDLCFTCICEHYVYVYAYNIQIRKRKCLLDTECARIHWQNFCFFLLCMKNYAWSSLCVPCICVIRIYIYYKNGVRREEMCGFLHRKKWEYNKDYEIVCMKYLCIYVKNLAS